MQLSLLELIEPQTSSSLQEEVLFEPNGRRRCEHCRKRLHRFGGRLICVNPQCTGVTR